MPWATEVWTSPNTTLQMLYSLYPSISYIWPTMSRRKIQHFETWLVCHTTDRCGRFLWSQITILQAILDGLCIHHFCSFVSSMSPSFLTLGQHHHWIFIFISYHKALRISSHDKVLSIIYSIAVSRSPQEPGRSVECRWLRRTPSAVRWSEIGNVPGYPGRM